MSPVGVDGQNREVRTQSSSSTSTLTYETARFTLRAPRVAVLFDGGADWQFWALTAMRDITHTWGGSGFVLVPHHAGEVNPTVVDVVRRYDPDFVIAAPRRIRHFENLRPGGLREVLDDCSVEQAAELLNTSSDVVVQDAAAGRAAHDVAERCSAYRRRIPGGQWDYGSFSLASDVGHSPTAADLTSGGPRLAVPPSWRGPIALTAAVSFGVIEAPAGDPETLDDEKAANVLSHAWQPDTWHDLPLELVHPSTGFDLAFDPAKQLFSLAATESGLAWVGRPRPLPNTFRYVVGDGADDFALAMILNRLSGNTFWIHPDWWPGNGTGIGRAVREATSSWFHSPSPRWTALSVLSTTMTPQDLQPWIKELQRPDDSILISDGVTWTHPNGQQRMVSVGVDAFDVECDLHLAAADQFDQQIPLPVIRDRDGTITVAASLPLPSTTAGNVAERPYQVDIALDAAVFPTGRGFDANTLLVPDQEWQTWVRSGRDAVSYQARRFDFVPAGSTQHGRLATPRLRLPGLSNWIGQMAGQSGYTVVSSDAGQKAALLATLWGGRSAVAAALAGPLRAVLDSMASPPKKGRDSYLDGQAIRLALDRGVINFEGIRSKWPGESDLAEVRDAVDTLTSNGVLRRGLMLRCPSCTLLSFIAVDDLAQTSRCTRCLGPVELARTNWGHEPSEEPTWFYDAHPLALGLLLSHGDVPFMLAAHLARAATRFADVGEVEFRRAGASCAEIDLIALVDDRLIVAEAKSTGSLGAGSSRVKAINKRLLVAQTLRCDEVIFATTASRWSSAVIDAVRGAVDTFKWTGMRPPTARMISGLGASVTESVA